MRQHKSQLPAAASPLVPSVCHHIGWPRTGRSRTSAAIPHSSPTTSPGSSKGRVSPVHTGDFVTGLSPRAQHQPRSFFGEGVHREPRCHSSSSDLPQWQPQRCRVNATPRLCCAMTAAELQCWHAARAPAGSTLLRARLSWTPPGSVFLVISRPAVWEGLQCIWLHARAKHCPIHQQFGFSFT